MSASPDDHLVTVLSRWLARRVTDDELRHEVETVDLTALSPDQAEAVEELRAGLRGAGGGGREMLVRETLEALALGG
jgi:hypothetical protein